MSATTLAAALTDWTDIDVAAHALALSIGAMPPDSAMRDAKHVYWSNNPLGSELVVLLDRLTSLGFLERRDEPDFQYRLRAEFPSDQGIADAWRRATTGRSVIALTLIVLRCADPERSRQFYEALGLSFTAEQHGAGPRHYSTRIGETVLELYPEGKAPNAAIRLGIGVPDVLAAVEAARSLGDFVVRCDSESSPPSALLRDPDENKIELTPGGK